MSRDELGLRKALLSCLEADIERTFRTLGENLYKQSQLRAQSRAVADAVVMRAAELKRLVESHVHESVRLARLEEKSAAEKEWINALEDPPELDPTPPPPGPQSTTKPTAPPTTTAAAARISASPIAPPPTAAGPAITVPINRKPSASVEVVGDVGVTSRSTASIAVPRAGPKIRTTVARAPPEPIKLDPEAPPAQDEKHHRAKRKAVPPDTDTEPLTSNPPPAAAANDETDDEKDTEKETGSTDADGDSTTDADDAGAGANVADAITVDDAGAGANVADAITVDDGVGAGVGGSDECLAIEVAPDAGAHIEIGGDTANPRRNKRLKIGVDAGKPPRAVCVNGDGEPDVVATLIAWNILKADGATLVRGAKFCHYCGARAASCWKTIWVGERRVRLCAPHSYAFTRGAIDLSFVTAETKAPFRPSTNSELDCLRRHHNRLVKNLAKFSPSNKTPLA